MFALHRDLAMLPTNGLGHKAHVSRSSYRCPWCPQPSRTTDADISLRLGVHRYKMIEAPREPSTQHLGHTVVLFPVNRHLLPPIHPCDDKDHNRCQEAHKRELETELIVRNKTFVGRDYYTIHLQSYFGGKFICNKKKVLYQSRMTRDIYKGEIQRAGVGGNLL